MLRIFHALEWTKSLDNHDKAAAELMQWFPLEHWRVMNKTYAGFGQLLQSDVKHQVAKMIREKAQRLGKPYLQMADKILLLKEYNV
jgi:endonuclease III